jgi:preprotein translocase, secE subunit
MKDVTQTTPGKGKPTPKNNEKPGFFKRMGRAIKETFGELKKVTWPSFRETMKQLGAVIAVVLLFLVVLTVFDLILGQGFQQFRQALGQVVSLITKKL